MPKVFIALLTYCVLASTCEPAAAQRAAPATLTEQELEAQRQNYVGHYCGGCHNVPPAAVLPRSIWPIVVAEMAALANEQLGEVFIPPDAVKNITQYYLVNAPESLPRLPLIPVVSQPVLFDRQAFGQRSRMPLVVNINAVELGLSKGVEFLVCDSESNTVSLLSREDNRWRERVLANVPVPAHTEVVDFDGDGDKDILIAALGVFPPVKTLAGKVILLRRESADTFALEILLQDVGRIADARPIDLDNDGDYDVAVAVFGGGGVGEIAWLENLGENAMQHHSILKLPGALNVSPIDLNQDGRTDIVSLISQEHEAVVGLLNKGNGQFETVTLARAGHPVSGSTGMRVVDLDGDNDGDILFTNGDALDLHADPKPYHGVAWLENKGNLDFQYRDIGRFYGTASAAAGDMDGDGDLDIVASSWNNFWSEPGRQSMVWFENDGHQQFSPRRLLGQTPGIVSFELRDMTGDGRMDIVSGLFHINALTAQITAKAKGEPDPTESIQDVSNRFLMLSNRASDHVSN